MGCIMAYFAQGRVFPWFNEKIKTHPFVFFTMGSALVMGVYVLGVFPAKSGIVGLLQKLTVFLGDPCDALGFALIILAVVYASNSALFRLLNARPLVYIGILSYSVYLWQQLFLGEGAFAQRPGIWNHWTISLFLIAVCGLFSYYAIEVPFLRLKERKKAAPSGGAPTGLGSAFSSPTTHMESADAAR